MATEPQILLVGDKGMFPQRVYFGAGKYAKEAGLSLGGCGMPPLAGQRIAPEEFSGDALIIVTPNLPAGLTKPSHCVCVAETQPLGYPCSFVLIDDHAVGRLAAQYLLSQMTANFAWYTQDNGIYGQQRLEEFRRVITKNTGKPVHEMTIIDGDDESRLDQWLEKLPRPCTIFAAHDGYAFRVLASCQRLGINVPLEIQVLGAGEHHPTVDLSEPTLSSIDLGEQRLGYRAAQILHKALQGHLDETVNEKLPPIGVRERQSTGIQKSDDPLIEKAFQALHTHLPTELRVDDLAKLCGVAPRTLEKHFQQAVGLSPRTALKMAQLHKAQHLLAMTNLPIAQIAEQCGFSSPYTFSTFFRRENGLTATAYRAQRAMPTND